MDHIKSCVGATARKVPSGWGLDGISSASSSRAHRLLQLVGQRINLRLTCGIQR
jgi:hypothetical protein